MIGPSMNLKQFVVAVSAIILCALIMGLLCGERIL